jgi:hypothetical protein
MEGETEGVYRPNKVIRFYLPAARHGLIANSEANGNATVMGIAQRKRAARAALRDP